MKFLETNRYSDTNMVLDKNDLAMKYIKNCNINREKVKIFIKA